EAYIKGNRYSMQLFRVSELAFLSCLVAGAQALPTIRVSSETAPVGGMAQMKLLITSPTPIISGNAAFDMAGVSLDSIDGINLFSATGDVAGAAVVNGNQFNLRFNSPNRTFGSSTDYPLMTAAV